LEGRGVSSKAGNRLKVSYRRFLKAESRTVACKGEREVLGKPLSVLPNRV